jgi:hypothetical protein
MLDLLWAVAAICVVLRSFLGALHLRHHAFYLTRDLVCLAVALELLVARQVARSLLDLAFCLWRRRWTGSASDTRGRRPAMLISEVGNVAGRQHQPSKASRAVQAALRDARSIARRHSLRVRRTGNVLRRLGGDHCVWDHSSNVERNALASARSAEANGDRSCSRRWSTSRQLSAKSGRTSLLIVRERSSSTAGPQEAALDHHMWRGEAVEAVERSFSWSDVNVRHGSCAVRCIVSFVCNVVARMTPPPTSTAAAPTATQNHGES